MEGLEEWGFEDEGNGGGEIWMEGRGIWWFMVFWGFEIWVI